MFKKIFTIIFAVLALFALADIFLVSSHSILHLAGENGAANNIWYYFNLRCHQLAERSLFFTGAQIPVCNRCLFVLAGKLFTLLMLANDWGKKFLEKNLQTIFSVIVPPLMIEAVLKIFFAYPSGVMVRSINGFLQGFLVFLVLYLLTRINTSQDQNGQNKRMFRIIM